MVITNKLLKVVKLSGKYDIITVQEIQQSHKFNRTKRIIKRTPWKMGTEEWRLNADRIRTKEII